jgi:hypothetical protein
MIQFIDEAYAAMGSQDSNLEMAESISVRRGGRTMIECP